MPARRPASRLALASALAAALALAGAAAPAGAAPPRPPAPPAAADDAPRASLLVTLAGPSVWQQVAPRLAGPDGRMGSAADVRARAADAHAAIAAVRDGVAAAQAPAADAVARTGARVVSRYTTLANGLLVHATADQAARLATIPGVVAVEPAPLVRPQLDASVPFIGAPALKAAKGYDGDGSYTAVIDTGVDYTHRQLGGPGTVAAYQAASAEGASERITDTFEGQPLFPTAKVVAGYDFVGRRYNPPHLCSAAQEAAGQCTTTPIPDNDPIDGGGHGTHVSGIVAGNAFSGGLSDGVAPGAKLVGLKIYGENGGDEAADVLVDAIEWCGNVNLGLETRGVVPPRVDAVNISLGEDWAVASSLFDTAAAAAAAAGVTIVASAGNSGNRAFIVGTPSASPPVISVASTVPPELGMAIEAAYDGATETHVGIESTVAVPFRTAVANLEGQRLEAALAWFGRGCNADSPVQDVAERVALIARGDCVFAEKLLNAQRAGAVAVLMFTNDQPKNGMGGDGAGVTIPAAMIDRAPGEALRDRLLAGTAVRVTFDPAKTALDTASADLIAGYSSRGPNARGHLKPDIAAPGSNILSARMGSGTGGASFNGTSMAGPHVAGAAGVIAQRNRAENLGLDGLEVGALLMNYSVPTVFAGGGIVPVPRQGAGRVDVLRAGTGPLLVRAGPIASVNLGLLALTGPTTVTRALTVTNLTDATVRFTVAARFRRAEAATAGLTIAPADVIHVLEPRETRVESVSFAIDPAALPDWTLDGPATGAGIAAVEAIELDGWLTVQPVDADARPLDEAVAPAAGVPFYLLARRASAITHRWARSGSGEPVGSQIAFENDTLFSGRAELFHRPAQRVLAGPTTPGAESDAWLPMPTDPDEPTVPAELDVAAVGVRAESYVSGTVTTHRLDFAIATHAPVVVPVPQQTQIFVDTDRDGAADWRIRAGDHRGPDGIVTFVGRWDAATAAITGTERITDTTFFGDVQSRVQVLSVPTALLGLDAPGPFDFWVVRRGTHEDWAHLGVPDVVPDGADGPGGPRLTFDPAHQARQPMGYDTVLNDVDRRGWIDLALGNTAGRDDGFLVVYPDNDSAPDAAAPQWAWISRAEIRPAPILLPAVFALYDAAAGP